MALTLYQSAKAFMQDMMNWTLKGGGFVSQEVANARAVICAGCHNNSSTAEIKGGCGACRRGASKMVELLFSPFLGSRRTPSDPKLKVCGLCGCPLRVSVWMPNQALLTKADANAYPSFCFKKAILEDKDIL